MKMNRKIRAAVVSVAALAALLTVDVALADWQGPWWYLGWHTVNWNQSPYYYPLSGEVDQYAEYSLYWDSGQGRYTQYRIETESFGYYYVDSGLQNGISVEVVDIYDYHPYKAATHTWYDAVYSGHFWKEYYPFSPGTLTKPTSGDYTQTEWQFRWNYRVGWISVWDHYTFYYATNQFEYEGALH
jgi:hypothetical protein